jgi:hypothetical protein
LRKSSAPNLRHTDGLDDLENRRSTHDEYEQGQDHGSDGRALALLLRRLGYVPSQDDVLTRLLVRESHPLLGCHLVESNKHGKVKNSTEKHRHASLTRLCRST